LTGSYYEGKVVVVIGAASGIGAVPIRRAVRQEREAVAADG
jgi:NAD(P)-dependent dehydrogenase (short-subunit alcohol dehydrogenase family)